MLKDNIGSALFPCNSEGFLDGHIASNALAHTLFHDFSDALSFYFQLTILTMRIFFLERYLELVHSLGLRETTVFSKDIGALGAKNQPTPMLRRND